ncbi:MAG: RnfABCDGE type electron transport complex subunit D [Tepidisphaeraceae bacterium]
MSGSAPLITDATPSRSPMQRLSDLRRLGGADAVDPVHSGIDLPRFVVMHIAGAVFPVTAGVLLFGWRALLSVCLVVGSAMLATVIWRRVGGRGRRLRFDHIAWLALLLALMLPAHLLSSVDPATSKPFAGWPLLAGAGIVLVVMVWLMGGPGSGRIHPVLVSYLILTVLFLDLLVPHYTLRRQHVFLGDLLNAVPATPSPTQSDRSRDAWIVSAAPTDEHHAIRSDPGAVRLEAFTGGHEAPERARLSLESLVRDRLPPLEDLIVGGEPAAIGCGSAIAVIIGGLFLLYRGVIDYRVPLLICVTALACFIVLPVPVMLTDRAPEYSWLVSRSPGVGWALGLTFANYELMASPLLFTAFFLATAPAIRPLARRARAVYAVLIGIAAALFQLYVSVSIGPYLALMAVSLLTPLLDHLIRPRTLV